MAEQRCGNGKEQVSANAGFGKQILLTGLWGGLFWSFIGQIGYYFHFTKIPPRVILEPWALGPWKNQWTGTVISIILLAVLSIGIAFIYAAALKKAGGLLSGIGYGIFLFLLVFLLLNPMFPGISPYRDLDRNTLVTSICLFVLYGVFIGYSISWEYKNEQSEGEVSE